MKNIIFILLSFLSFSVMGQLDTINVGRFAGDRRADNMRDAFSKVNSFIHHYEDITLSRITVVEADVDSLYRGFVNLKVYEGPGSAASPYNIITATNKYPEDFNEGTTFWYQDTLDGNTNLFLITIFLDDFFVIDYQASRVITPPKP